MRHDVMANTVWFDCRFCEGPIAHDGGIMRHIPVGPRHVLGSARTLSKESGTLKGEVEKFLATVRAA